MKKIQTLFERDWEGDRSRVTETVTPGCEWVLDGEGTATRKYDGTCMMFDGEKWWSRREVKDGKQPPEGFVSSGHDHVTLKNVGWEPAENSPFAKFHAEAIESGKDFEPGTYELIGPKVQGNPENAGKHTLINHENAETYWRDGLTTFESIREFLRITDAEGIVFHHPNGRMAKIKRRDFGFKR